MENRKNTQREPASSVQSTRKENSKNVKILSTTYKVFPTILRNKLEPLAENIIGDYQTGFRAERSTTDQLCAIKKFWKRLGI